MLWLRRWLWHFGRLVVADMRTGQQVALVGFLLAKNGLGSFSSPFLFSSEIQNNMGGTLLGIKLSLVWGKYLISPVFWKKEVM